MVADSARKFTTGRGCRIRGATFPTEDLPYDLADALEHRHSDQGHDLAYTANIARPTIS